MSGAPIEDRIAAVRLRPSMWVYDGYSLLDEAMAHAIRAHEAGRVRSLRVELGADGRITIEDDGPSVAIEIGAAAPTIEHGLDEPPGAEDRATRGTEVRGGTLSRGLWLVRALATTMTVESRVQGVAAAERYAGGARVARHHAPCSADDRWTRISFVIDERLVRESPRPVHERVSQRLAVLAAVYPELSITLAARMTSGLEALLLARLRPEDLAHPEPLVRGWRERRASVDVAVALLSAPIGAIQQFANGRGCTEGIRLRTALRDAIHRVMPLATKPHPDHELAHLSAIVSIRSPDVRLGGSTATVLEAPDLRDSVKREVAALFDETAARRPAVLDAWRAALTRRATRGGDPP